jgi:hypothetical protein
VRAWQKRSTPLLITATDAADRIRAGLARNDAIVAFPLPLYLFVHAMSTLPASVRRVAWPHRSLYTHLRII